MVNWLTHSIFTYFLFFFFFLLFRFVCDCFLCLSFEWFLGFVHSFFASDFGFLRNRYLPVGCCGCCWCCCEFTEFRGLTLEHMENIMAVAGFWLLLNLAWLASGWLMRTGYLAQVPTQIVTRLAAFVALSWACLRVLLFMCKLFFLLLLLS